MSGPDDRVTTDPVAQGAVPAGHRSARGPAIAGSPAGPTAADPATEARVVRGAVTIGGSSAAKATVRIDGATGGEATADLAVEARVRVAAAATEVPMPTTRVAIATARASGAPAGETKGAEAPTVATAEDMRHATADRRGIASPGGRIPDARMDSSDGTGRLATVAPSVARMIDAPRRAGEPVPARASTVAATGLAPTSAMIAARMGSARIAGQSVRRVSVGSIGATILGGTDGVLGRVEPVTASRRATTARIVPNAASGMTAAPSFRTRRCQKVSHWIFVSCPVA